MPFYASLTISLVLIIFTCHTASQQQNAQNALSVALPTNGDPGFDIRMLSDFTSAFHTCTYVSFDITVAQTQVHDGLLVVSFLGAMDVLRVIDPQNCRIVQNCFGTYLGLTYDPVSNTTYVGVNNNIGSIDLDTCVVTDVCDTSFMTRQLELMGGSLYVTSETQNVVVVENFPASCAATNTITMPCDNLEDITSIGNETLFLTCPDFITTTFFEIFDTTSMISVPFDTLTGSRLSVASIYFQPPRILRLVNEMGDELAVVYDGSVIDIDSLGGAQLVALQPIDQPVAPTTASYVINGVMSSSTSAPFRSDLFPAARGTVVVEYTEGPIMTRFSFVFNRAQISGDPHFVGFEGQHYDFHGYPNTVFNIISDEYIQVNSLFLNADLRPQKVKTYMGAVGIKVCHPERGQLHFIFACNRSTQEGVIKLHSADGDVNILPKTTHSYGDQLTVKRSSLENAKTTVTTSYGYNFQFRFSSSSHSSCHINMRSKYNKKEHSHTIRPHGVLGQSTRITANAIGEGPNSLNILEGKVEDYIELDLFSSLSKFTLYKPSCSSTTSTKIQQQAMKNEVQDDKGYAWTE